MASGVEFDEDTIGFSGQRPSLRQAGFPAQSSGSAAPEPGYGAPRASGMAGWLVAHGFAKSQRSAEGIMIAVIVLDIIVTILVIHYLL